MDTIVVLGDGITIAREVWIVDSNARRIPVRIQLEESHPGRGRLS